MDRLESLGSQLSQITMYDIKSVYNQAKNMVLNVSEMEAKVREATNDDPWGASSTLMQEIAQGTFNFQQFNEIMPCIYSRFMDKEARQWREIYKALQLLEYIIKHGSERVVDDARSHLSTIKMLRNFHYIDEKGKDQGINVRNRSKELSEMLSDVERIRTERRKAKANRNKYVGTGNDGMSFSGGDSRYGGFGNDNGGGGSRAYGDRDYGGYSGSSSGFRDSSDRRGFEEYNAGEDEVTVPRRSASMNTGGASASNRATSGSGPGAGGTSRPTQKAAEKVVDLLGFDDNDFGGSASTTLAAPATEKALPAVTLNPLDDDDEFADFQTAPAPAPAAQALAPKPTVYEFFNAAKPATPTMAPLQPLQPQLTPQNQFQPTHTQRPSTDVFGRMTPVVAGARNPPPGILSPTSPRSNAFPSNNTASRPAASTTSSFSSNTSGGHAKSGSVAGGFDDLWSLSLGSSAGGANAAANAGGGKSMKDLEKEKAQAGIWGQKTGGAGAMGAFGAFGTTGGGSSGGSGGLDDLLL